MELIFHHQRYLGASGGDEVLKQTAATITASIREAGILIRFGGEEFLLFMPKTTAAGAMVIPELVYEC